MSYRYELDTPGQLPLKLKAVKSHLRVEHDADDTLINDLIRTTVRFGELQTGREFRANAFTLTLDAFEDRICIRRSPVISITSVKYLLATVLTTVATSVYYLKKSHGWSEILLPEDQLWPVDGDVREAGIEIEFIAGPTQFIDQAKAAVLRHIAALYECRGDGEANAKDVAVESGAALLYNQIGIPKV